MDECNKAVDEGSKAVDEDSKAAAAGNKVVADDALDCKLVYKREVDTLVSDRFALEGWSWWELEHELELELFCVVML